MRGDSVSGGVKRIGDIVKKKSAGMLLYLLLIPMFISVVISLFSGDYGKFLYKLAAFAIFYLSALAVSRGVRYGIEYEESEIAKAPVPYRLAGAVLFGIGIFTMGFIVGRESLFVSIFVSLLGMAGVFMLYGMDPTEDKLPDDIDMDPDIVFKSLEEARDALEMVKIHGREIGDMTLRRAVDSAVERAEKVLKAIGEDPGGIRAARKFLVVYIDGVEKVIQKYIVVQSHGIDDETRERMLSLLDEVSGRFEKEMKRLEEEDRFSLDVEIDTLREQIVN
jgi:5-bromo-4-chloroindolyl phosphate hydrolysis protein